MGLLDALQDKGFRSDVADGLRNALNRGLLGGVLGAPVDLATMALRPLGYKVAQPVMGSDWIGQKLQDAGMVSNKRNHLAEMMAGLLDPATMATGAVKAAAAAPMVAGMFIGKGAKTWDALQAAKALELEKAGTPARQIWSETGTWKGPDGMWRQEIPDNMAKSRDYQLTPAKAYERARVNAMIEDSQSLRDKANSMTPYADKTKNQLTDAYRETGGQIVDAALSGNTALATQLSDARSGLTSLMGEMASPKYGPASSYLKHGELGQAYPDVYAMHTRIDPAELSNARGEYMRPTPIQGEQILLAEKPMFKDAQSTMLHEMQHAIQQREGFAKGGSPDTIYQETQNAKKKIDGYNKTISTVYRDFEQARANGDITKATSLKSQYDELMGKRGDLVAAYQLDPMDGYRRLAGEAEARATQARIPLDASQRRAIFPEDSYDVPVNQLIVRQDGLLGPQMATVWHGSPHQFSKFDASKIGTGEGAQAYGHGLYLAESPDVAKSYATGNQGRAAATDGLLDALPKPVQMDVFKVMNMRDGFIKDAMRNDLVKQYPQAAGVFDAKSAKLYKVDLPDDQIAKMLDWDKPLSQQHPDVQAAMRDLNGKDALGRPLERPQPLNMDSNGQWAYQNIQNGRNQRLASEALQKAGIPGIRYLDGGSRGAGAGSSNFVVFPGNEDMLTILERNGQPVNTLRGLLDR